jgi:prepilin-type N-terminal cleavage/methylation domain-containing protein
VRELRSRRPARVAGDRGLTLTEMLVVMAISSVIATFALTFLASFTERQREQAGRFDAQLAAAAVDAQLTRDAAVAVAVAVLPVADYPTTLTLVGTGGSTIVWQRVGAELRRTEQVGGVPVTATVLTGITSAAPTFSYWAPTGTELVPATVGADTLAYCATRVRIDLTYRSGPGADTLERDLALVRRDPGGLSC